MQLARVHLSRGDLAEAERRAAAVVADASRRSDNHTQRARGRPGAGRGGGRCDGRPRRRSRSSTRAEREAGADAAFSMPRMCLQRAPGPARPRPARRGRGAVAAGLVAAREQELPYEEALLLRVAAPSTCGAGSRPEAASAQARSRPTAPHVARRQWR